MEGDVSSFLGRCKIASSDKGVRETESRVLIGPSLSLSLKIYLTPSVYMFLILSSNVTAPNDEEIRGQITENFPSFDPSQVLLPKPLKELLKGL